MLFLCIVQFWFLKENNVSIYTVQWIYALRFILYSGLYNRELVHTYCTLLILAKIMIGRIKDTNLKNLVESFLHNCTENYIVDEQFKIFVVQRKNNKLFHIQLKVFFFWPNFAFILVSRFLLVLYEPKLSFIVIKSAYYFIVNCNDFGH